MSQEPSLPPDVLTVAGFSDKTATYANPALRADVSTDDWPFLYMPERIYPFSYLIMVGLVLVLSLTLTASFLPGRPQPGSVPFFLLGAGFMLVETKSITELGLTFGNSWQVIGLVIAGIMVMAYCRIGARFRGSYRRIFLELCAEACWNTIPCTSAFNSCT
jgi:hypothetical protein